MSHSRSQRVGGERGEGRSFLAYASDRPVVVGALKVSALVGTLLNAINQGDRLLAAQWSDVVWWRVALTYLVPFCVSVFSAARIRVLMDRQPPGEGRR